MCERETDMNQNQPWKHKQSQPHSIDCLCIHAYTDHVRTSHIQLREWLCVFINAVFHWDIIYFTSWQPSELSSCQYNLNTAQMWWFADNPKICSLDGSRQTGDYVYPFSVFVHIKKNNQCSLVVAVINLSSSFPSNRYATLKMGDRKMRQ